MDVPVEVNRLLFDYDQILIIGPVFPHEVVGFSGGNKYLFPGVAGAEILNFFHWLGAVVTNPMIIGNKWTPVRRVVDRAGAMVNASKLCFCLVVDHGEMAGLFRRVTGSGLGRCERSVAPITHRLQGAAVSYHPLLRSADGRRAMDGWQVHVSWNPCWPTAAN